jgi:hypothetical protein
LKVGSAAASEIEPEHPSVLDWLNNELWAGENELRVFRSFIGCPQNMT